MKTCDTNRGAVAYELYGSSGPVLAIDACICSCSAEWWHIAKKIGSRCRVLVFDRMGYGGSAVSEWPRTPENIASEFNALLEALSITGSILLLGTHRAASMPCNMLPCIRRKSVVSFCLIPPLRLTGNL
jgi:hypothetical protein